MSEIERTRAVELFFEPSAKWAQYIIDVRDTDEIGTRGVLLGFPNHYCASIITGGMSYGVELAIFHQNTWTICYATQLTGASGVIGWLTPQKLGETLEAILALPRKDDCTHGRLGDLNHERKVES